MVRFDLVRVLSGTGLSLLVAGAIACGGSSTDSRDPQREAAPSSTPAARGPEGTYTNANGMATLDLKAGGQASFTVMGETQTCTYSQEAARLTLTCNNQDTFEFTLHGDGSITPVGTFIGTMKKSTP